MKTINFNKKVCWITGASSGIGAALASTLNKMGATLIISARNMDNLENVKRSCPCPDNISVLPFDMEKTDDLIEITKTAWNINQGIDFVFLNAGMAVRDMIINTNMDMVYKVMNINFFSNVVISKTLLPLMRERGSGCFVVTSSLCGKFGLPKLGAYSASKHALHGFYESLRAEYYKDGIAVTMITAGLVNTNITLHALNGNGTIHGRMQESIAAGISPDVCATGIIQAVAKRKCEAAIGGMEKYSLLIKRFFPGLFRKALSKNPVKRLRNAGLMPSANYEISVAPVSRLC